MHQNFDLPAPFVLHTDCPHYWRYHLPGRSTLLNLVFCLQDFYSIYNCDVINYLGETEEDFSTRLANNLEELILKEGPETVSNPCLRSSRKMKIKCFSADFTIICTRLLP